MNIIDKTFDEIQTDSDVAQFKADEDPQVFKNIFAKWIGKRDSARTKATVEAVKFKDVPGDPKQIIKAIEGGDVKVSPKQKKYITKLRQTYDRLFNEAKEAGIDMNYQKDYLTHIWEKPIDQVRAEYQTAKQKFGFSGERTIPTYEEGIKMGLKPKYSNPVEILSEYVRRLETTKANIELFKDLKEQGLIVSGSKVANDPNFTPVNAPGFPRAIFRIGNNKTVISNWYAPKNVANQINNIMTPQDNGRMGKIFKKTAKLSSTVQDITMSGGLPKTPLNAWTAAQATKEILSGRVVSPLTSFVRSLSGKSSNKFFQENAQQIIKMQERNIPVSTTFTVDNLIDSKTATKTFGEAIGSKWNKLMNEPTFRRFMPQLQINLFNDIEAGLLKAGKTETEAADIAAQAVKNFYGVKGSDKVAAGSKLWNDMVTTGLFAPKYRESMINFWVNNLKAVKKPFAPENITNTKFVIGAFLTYLGMNAINKANTGNDMADNPSGKEDKMLIKTKDGYIGVPFLSSIATMPRMGYMAGKQLVEGDVAGAVNTVAKGSTSSLIRPIADIMSNEDYYGSPIYDESSGKPWGDIGLYLAGKYNHPYIRETLNIVGQNLPENTKKQLGISKNPVPLYQTLSKGLELPFRFYNNNKGRDALATARYFDDKKLIEKSLSKEDKETWNLLKKKSGEQNILNSQQKALLLLNNPQLQQAEEAMAIQAMNRGETVDPIWELPPSWRKVVWASRVQLPGQKNTYDTLLSQQPWYKEFKEKQNQFYDSVGSSETNTGSLMPYPEPSAYVQQQMDAKNWKDPEVQAWFTARDQYYNQQLMALGLPPMSTDSGFSSRKGKSKRAITVKLSEPKKISITWKPMKRNLPTLKLAKAPTIKLAAPSRKYTIAA